MKAFYSDVFELPLPEGHRFPMAKYRLLRERVLAEGIVEPEDLLLPPPAEDEALLRVHTAEYLLKLTTGTLSIPEIRRIGFPWSPKMVERSRRSVGATLAAANWALKEGVAANLAGGTHHAFADCGEGFCIFNDVAVAIRDLQARELVRRAIVIDLDVHQGNGTAAIFASDASVFTLSLHGAKNFPLRKFPSDLDVPLTDGIGDAEYLEALAGALDAAFASQAEEGARFHVAFYIAGADPYERDRLGRLKLTLEGLRQRDVAVFERCERHGLPVVLTMGGGYSPDPHDIAEVHAQTIAEAKAWWRRRQVTAP
ncbi:MAG TPA: histone deacetylase [Pirellulaceae bacterium]|jgi:acetoin utilization deacetylase AcuC-like enzyme|nr:histone deacetylase [Pirellulaceae bacterium]